MALTMAERRSITREMARRYARASKKQRGLMLDELCALAGYNRSYAARLLREGARGPAPPRRRVRPRTYTSELLPALRKVWATLDRICGKRLAAVMEPTIAALEHCGEISLTPEQRALLHKLAQAAVPTQSWAHFDMTGKQAEVRGAMPADYHDLGRFRNALLLDEYHARPTRALEAFIRLNGLQSRGG